MTELIFPTGQDIYLEVNGRKLAVVESYRARSDRELYPVEAMGESEPSAMQFGRTRYTLELNRVYPCGGGDGVDFHALQGFNLVVAKPDRRIVFTDCQWSSITESAGINDTLMEQVTLSAGRRTEWMNQ
ncbi:MAG: hypothetical protein HFE39_09035 [Clostridiales bacterium]|jgi:hypothetical protein|nr:hypothetical protein [Clostridiales bacterium]